MIHVLTEVAPSPIAGVGLFLSEPITKGQLVYSDDPIFVQVLTLAQIAELPASAQVMLKRYTYRGRGGHALINGVYFCNDDGRFMNHSDTPTLVYRDTDASWVAARDLPVGTELTCDYRLFEDPSDWEPFLKGE